MAKKKTLRNLNKMKRDGEKITYITSYDAQTSRLAEEAGIDMILVGDSVGNNVLGYADTRPVTMDQMITVTQAVRRGAPNTFIVGDMPLGSYQPSDEEAIRNAIRFIKETECDAVKCEGGMRMAGRVQAMNDSGVAVMGHLGYTPQSTNLVGVVQGNNTSKFESLFNDVVALRDAGAFAILLEAVPNYPAGRIAKEMNIPIYGIGAGRDVDGVLAIMNDVIGLGTFESKFVKHYADTNKVIGDAVKAYVDEVRSDQFPAEEHFYPLEEGEKENIDGYFESIKKDQ